MMIAIATPEMINPVADQCEANGIPCLSTLAPWQPYFFGRERRPGEGLRLDVPLLLGCGSDGRRLHRDVELDPEQQDRCHVRPNDPDGLASSDAKTGFPAGAAPRGYKVIDGGRYNTGYARLLGDDRPVQGRRRAGRHPDSARLRHLLEAGQVSRASTRRSPPSPRACCSRPRSRRSATLATASAPRSGGHRAIRSRARSPGPSCQGARRRVHQGRPASSGPSSSASSTRCSRSRFDSIVTRRFHRQEEARRCHRSHQTRHHGRADLLQARRPAEERVPDPARWRPVAEDSTGPNKFELVITNNKQAPQHPDGRQAQATGLIRGGHCSLSRASPSDFGALTVTDDLSFDVAEGRGARHRRPERRRQDHVAEPRRRRPPARHRADHLRRATTSRGSPSHTRCHLGIGRTSQIPRPFEGLTVFENVLVGATFGAGSRITGSPRGRCG